MNLHRIPTPEQSPVALLLQEINEVDSALDSVCELLNLSSPHKVDAGGLYSLLLPLRKRLSKAADGLTDLKL